MTDLLTAQVVIETIGWLASALTIATYSMSTMMPLRALALASSISFLLYGVANELWPLVAMELILIPINAYRLWQILSLRGKLDSASETGVDDFSIIRRYGRQRRLAAGDTVFRRGDSVDQLYLVDSGAVLIEEYGARIEAGDIFGEIAFFNDSGRRTASARCAGDTVLYELDKTRFMRLQFEDPGFGLAVMRTVTRRLSNGRPGN